MFLRSALSSLALASVLFLGACGGSDEEAPRMPAITLTEMDPSSALSLEVGQEITVTLPATAGTGYVWEVQQKAPGVLQQVGEPVYAKRALLPNMMGESGLIAWAFRAAKPGTDTLRFSYQRPWGSQQPAKTREWEITVHGKK